MRHQNVSGEAAVDLNAEVTRCCAEIFFARLAGCAFAAADPRKYGRRGANLHVRIGTGLLDHAGNLVTERERQRTVRRDVQLPVAAEAEIAIVKMQVRMADATAA